MNTSRTDTFPTRGAGSERRLPRPPVPQPLRPQAGGGKRPSEHQQRVSEAEKRERMERRRVVTARKRPPTRGTISTRTGQRHAEHVLGANALGGGGCYGCRRAQASARAARLPGPGCAAALLGSGRSWGREEAGLERSGGWGHEKRRSRAPRGALRSCVRLGRGL